jgi:hypothetical protein
MVIEDFRSALESLINCHSQENGSNTPDFILAKYLVTCMKAFDVATAEREVWYGRVSEPTSCPTIESEKTIQQSENRGPPGYKRK